ncbi:MAG: hypothetical protein Q8M53_08415 [Burkholderiales bacterium]|nr:hypothetical protein [Burkholderiales bacterium]
MLDKTIQEAINSAVRDAGQKKQLSNKLLAWVESVVSGNEDIHDPDSSIRHLELLFDAVELKDAEEG